jgi:ATP-dependent RNA helicase RhlE
MGFKALSLSAHVLQTLEAEGYSMPTPIQAQAIPHILAGKDVLGVAQTGTGKTAAFAVPIIERLLDPAHKILGAGEQPSEAHNVAKAARKIRALILSPTRELAGQIEESFKTYGRGTSLRETVVYGGVSAHWQIKALFHGVDVLVATPGRLLDLMSQGYVDLRYVQTLVLDEADQMLDMGFIDPIRKIVARTPATRQSLMFSATMPPEIRKLADTILKDPVTVQVSPVSSTVGTIDQSVYFVDKGAKPSLLVKYIQDNGITRALVFTRTKHGADKVAKYLQKAGIRSAALHGNKTQGQRRKAMEQFVGQRPPVMVATDIAARGLDIDNVSHVVNYDLPNIPESYVHRIGRTGRAGASGFAVSFCDPEERAYLRNIERLTKQQIRVAGEAAAPAGTHSHRHEGHAAGGERREPRGPRGHVPGEKPAAVQHRKPQAAGHPLQSHGHRSAQGHAASHRPHGPRQEGAASHSPSHKPGHVATHKPAHAPTHKPVHLPHKPAQAGSHKPAHALTHKPAHAPTHKPAHPAASHKPAHAPARPYQGPASARTTSSHPAPRQGGFKPAGGRKQWGPASRNQGGGRANPHGRSRFGR